MPSVRGKSDVRAFIAVIPEQLTTRVLRGAGRAAANVIANEAKDRSISDEVSGAIKVATSVTDGLIIAKVQVKGRGAYIAPWLEYGTDPHFISVDERQREGKSVARINRDVKEGSLVIGGQFVGSTVWHPGARPNPFLRPALDIKEADAIRAAQQYISSRVKGGRIIGTDEGDEA